ncbi:uncharacterized protein BXZ73DRAFT_79597 [Epithele typhae]|uniref:uncharacterized protein n=1 Tax=Epithele typhae TaxID=378194 RepID=UPI0020081A19|nr:uncharacterized protein BXZ73DRAFT_79597 [Epithele typhae]KAH9923195.1 hypothetical protein BXZ73DRAFT_79597 [Epithele typhae]
MTRVEGSSGCFKPSKLQDCSVLFSVHNIFALLLQRGSATTRTMLTRGFIYEMQKRFQRAEVDRDKEELTRRGNWQNRAREHARTNTGCGYERQRGRAQPALDHGGDELVNVLLLALRRLRERSGLLQRFVQPALECTRACTSRTRGADRWAARLARARARGRVNPGPAVISVSWGHSETRAHGGLDVAELWAILRRNLVLPDTRGGIGSGSDRDWGLRLTTISRIVADM